MIAAVVYRSMTGHSKKIAKAVATALDVSAVDIKNKPTFNGLDVLFIAGGIYSGKCSQGLVEFVKRLDNSVKKAVLLTSSASDKVGQDEIRQILISKGIEVAGEFRCKGGFLLYKIGHPNKKEILDAVSYSKKFFQ